MTDPTDLPGLVAKWRRLADVHRSNANNNERAAWFRENHAGKAFGFRTCADETEAALRAAPQGEPVAPVAHLSITETSTDLCLIKPGHNKLRNRFGLGIFPLYTHPAPAAADVRDDAMWTADPVEALRRIAESDGGHAAVIARECLRRMPTPAPAASVIGVDYGSPDGDCTVEGVKHPDGSVEITKVTRATRGEWVMVPREPTREMWDAINKTDSDAYAGGNQHGAGFEWLWKVALAAAAEPQIEDGWLEQVPDVHREMVFAFGREYAKRGGGLTGFAIVAHSLKAALAAAPKQDSVGVGEAVLRIPPELLDFARDTLALVQASSKPPFVWQAHSDITADQCIAKLTEAVCLTVTDERFTGELHLIAEASDEQNVVAFTGCGPNSAGNARLLIACAHLVMSMEPQITAALGQAGAK